MSENAARSFTAPFVLADAINRAKSTEPEAVVKALRETNIPGDQVIYPWKGVKFDPQTQQNIYATGTLVQIQNQQYVTVWPFESAAKDVGVAVPGLEVAKVACSPAGGAEPAPPAGCAWKRWDDGPSNCCSKW